MGNQPSRIPCLQDLAPNPFERNMEVILELKREHLILLLTWMGDYIEQNSTLEITLVVGGGAVDVIGLRTRPTTHDVDWFKSQLSPAEGEILQKAYYNAIERAKKAGIVLPFSWFNNKTMLFVEPATRESLYSHARQQNYVVF
ncbi:hypothetical protein BJX63DRAFT_429617 [Aspergillus granulosus]|uniref:Uncharacterized protein n=1 Tax=Aspergillus granulosus TaxID=176169 RepID=A0ABR4HSB9_9EURO